MRERATYTENETVVHGRPSFGIDELIAPTTIDTFMADYWEKYPLVVHRDDPDYYASVLTLEDVDGVLATSSLNDGDLRLVAEGQETPISQLIPESVEGKINGLEALYAQYRSGATVNLMFLNDRWPALTALCRTLASQLSASIHGNVYLTPPGSQGLTPHHDTHDVFVCQLYGTKNWTLHPTQTQLPLQNQGYALPAEGAGAPTQDFVLRPGDLAYLPRGTVHAAKANEEASLHLTIGVSPMVWADVIRVAVDQVCAADVRFRSGLPAGFVTSEEIQDVAAVQLRELLDALLSVTSAPKLIDQMASAMLQRRPPTLEGHLLDLEALPAVDLKTTVRRRRDLQWLVTKDDEEIHLEFHGKTIDLPEYVDKELAFITDADGFCGADIPGSLDDAGRLVLVRRLLQEDFLTKVS